MVVATAMISPRSNATTGPPESFGVTLTETDALFPRKKRTEPSCKYLLSPNFRLRSPLTRSAFPHPYTVAVPKIEFELSPILNSFANPVNFEVLSIPIPNAGHC